MAETIDSARADTLKMYMATNAPDTFGEGLFSFLVIYLDCNLWVNPAALCVDGFNGKPDKGVCIQSSKMHTTTCVNVDILKSKSCLH